MTQQHLFCGYVHFRLDHLGIRELSEAVPLMNLLGYAPRLLALDKGNMWGYIGLLLQDTTHCTGKTVRALSGLTLFLAWTWSDASSPDGIVENPDSEFHRLCSLVPGRNLLP
jgi:hypothetical protein